MKETAIHLAVSFVRKAVMTEYKLISGFTVEVTPMSPYSVDFVNDQFPLPKRPKRKLTLVAETIDYDYEPPSIVPSETDVDEYALYVKYMEYSRQSTEVETLRERARRDFLLSTCVRIIGESPISLESTEWVDRLEAAFPNYKVPTHPGKRFLAFLKSVVITHTLEAELIVRSALFSEVDMQGIESALRGFRTSL
jgi:hypothetical protein